MLGRIMMVKSVLSELEDCPVFCGDLCVKMDVFECLVIFIYITTFILLFVTCS